MAFFEELSGILASLHKGNVELADFDFENGVITVRGTLNIGDQTLSEDNVRLIVNGIGGGYKVARGIHTMLSASDTVATGLASVVAVVASMESDPIATCDRCTAAIGNQSDAPVAGSVYLKVWMPTATANTAPVAADGFATIKVNWIAIGT